AALEFVKSRKSPTAIFASSDYVALVVLNAAHRFVLKMPESLSLIGFDQPTFAEPLQRPLPTIRQPARDMRAQRMNMLLKVVAGPRVEPIETRLPVELIRRDSVRMLQSKIRGATNRR